MAHHDYMYVSAAETSLRDRVATMYNKMGTVHNGDRVEVLERERRFVRVRTDGGQEGWIERAQPDRSGCLRRLPEAGAGQRQHSGAGHGTTRAELNMHVTASRDAEHLYQLKDGEKVEVLRRATADKNPPKPAKPAPSATASAKKKGATTTTQPKAAALRKPPRRHRQLRLQPRQRPARRRKLPPLPCRSPASHRRRPSPSWKIGISCAARRACRLGAAAHARSRRPARHRAVRRGSAHRRVFRAQQRRRGWQAAAAISRAAQRPKDGLAWDYNQIRVFTRNRAKHRYETAYREHNLEGYLPVRVGHQDFGKEGDLPTFTIRKKNDAGQIVDATYKMNGPIVRRVLTPEEAAAEKRSTRQLSPPA